jgi:hypothetical protein
MTMTDRDTIYASGKLALTACNPYAVLGGIIRAALALEEGADPEVPTAGHPALLCMLSQVAQLIGYVVIPRGTDGLVMPGHVPTVIRAAEALRTAIEPAWRSGTIDQVVKLAWMNAAVDQSAEADLPWKGQLVALAEAIGFDWDDWNQLGRAFDAVDPRVVAATT